MGVVRLMLVFLVIANSRWNQDLVLCSTSVENDGFTDEQVEALTEDVNNWRSAEPKAANLHRIIYSAIRSREAKVFTDKCEIPRREDHGMFGETWLYSWTSDIPDNGSSPLLPIYTKYDYETDSCDPNAKNCDFFKNILSDQLFWIGCSRNSSCQNNFTQITVCVMEYRNNLQPTYIQGPSCSKCERREGRLCHNNLCVTQRVCDQNKWNCTCEVKCENCATLDPVKCECECRYGFDRVDCSETCKDFEDCENIVGYGYNVSSGGRFGYFTKKGKDACKLNLMVSNRWCRKTCGTCRDATEPVPDKSLTHRCCPNLTCPFSGQTPDFVKCECLGTGATGQPDFDIRDYLPKNYCPGQPTSAANGSSSPVFQLVSTITVILAIRFHLNSA